jgi:hypothetical protein
MRQRIASSSQEKRVGLDGVEQITGVPNGTPETKSEIDPDTEPDPYTEWFDSHVLQGDTF